MRQLERCAEKGVTIVLALRAASCPVPAFMFPSMVGNGRTYREWRTSVGAGFWSTTAVPTSSSPAARDRRRTIGATRVAMHVARAGGARLASGSRTSSMRWHGPQDPRDRPKVERPNRRLYNFSVLRLDHSTSRRRVSPSREPRTVTTARKPREFRFARRLPAARVSSRSIARRRWRLASICSRRCW